LAIERCDGRPSGPLSLRDVTVVYKPSGAPDPVARGGSRLRPSPQLRLDLES
jgi:hypothetical protein